jgi:hypothetical protein
VSSLLSLRWRKPNHLKHYVASPEKVLVIHTLTHKAAVRISLHTTSLKSAYQVQHSSLTTGQLLYWNCYIQIEQNSGESNDTQNDAKFTQINCLHNFKRPEMLYSVKWVFSLLKKRWLSNEPRIALGKRKLQQVYAVKIFHHTGFRRFWRIKKFEIDPAWWRIWGTSPKCQIKIQ